MSYRFIYCQEVNRVIPAVLIDARASIHAIKNQIGTVIKAYTDAQIDLIGEKSIPYRIETDKGSLAGYMTLEVGSTAAVAIVGQFVLRPAFEQFLSEISGQISSFITNNLWHDDFLL